MNYVYVLYSKKDQKLYTGCTKDLKKRFAEHNSGEVRSTKDRRPLEMIFYEAFTDIDDAFAREKWLKSGWGRRHLGATLSNTLKNLGGEQ